MFLHPVGEGPDLIPSMDAVPAAQIIGVKQEEHGGDRLPELTVRSLHLNGTALHFPIPTAFGVRLELPDGDQIFERHLLSLGRFRHSLVVAIVDGLACHVGAAHRPIITEHHQNKHHVGGCLRMLHPPFDEWSRFFV